MYIGESSSSSVSPEPGQYQDMDLPVRSQSLLYRMPTKSFSIGNDFHIMKMYVCMYTLYIFKNVCIYVCKSTFTYIHAGLGGTAGQGGMGSGVPILSCRQPAISASTVAFFGDRLEYAFYTQV